MAVTNYLALGDLIVNKLRSSVTSIEYIESAIDLSTILNSTIVTPSLYVYYVSDDLGSYAGKGVTYEIKQTWAVVIVIKNLSDQSYRLAELGELVHEVLINLYGWLPTDTKYGPLYREASPSPATSDGGYVYFPLHFSSRFLTQGL